MINFHPDTNMLSEYATGSLDWALSISVAAHVQMCPKCRRCVDDMNTVGGTLLEELTQEDSNSISFDKDAAFASLMSRVKSEGDQVPPSPQSGSTATKDPALKNLPRVVNKLLPQGGIKWQRVSGALRMARLVTGQEKYEVAFHRISCGGKVAEHNHRGLEVTLVLHGSFSDSDGMYAPGDFLVKKPGEVHKPTATENQECLCLSVVAAPVSLTGFLGKVINPFLSVRPA